MKNNKYKIVELDQLTSNKVLIATIPFNQLIKKTKFTVRELPVGDILNNDNFENKNEYYQRLRNDDRTKEIAGFILKNIANRYANKNSYIGLFPSAIILSYNSSDLLSADEYYKSLEDDQLDEKGIFIDDNYIIIPDSREGLIVDGQHRLAGFQLLHELANNKKIKVGRKILEEAYPGLEYSYVIEQIEKYSFPCTILLDFDLWEQGRVFANVNFKQKPVNRSLYYDIFGSFPDPDKNDIYIAHHYTVYLNNNPTSPLKGKIKLHGVGQGIFSQAFFVEALLETFKKGHAFNFIVYEYATTNKINETILKFFKIYFSAISEVFKDYWPQSNENTSRSYHSVLLKTNSLGALIKLSEVIYKDLVLVFTDLDTASDDELKEVIIKKYLTKISDKGAEYFSSNSAYARGGSKGLQTELFQKLKRNLNL